MNDMPPMITDNDVYPRLLKANLAYIDSLSETLIRTLETMGLFSDKDKATQEGYKLVEGTIGYEHMKIKSVQLISDINHEFAKALSVRDAIEVQN